MAHPSIGQPKPALRASETPLTLPRPTDPSYLYKAEVRDVIDADTPEGAAGRRFVRNQLAA